MRTSPILPGREREIRLVATSPEINAWVLANAGSGKTTILGNRVIRLLLAGAAPDRILCLTFTKAAAAEMQTRIFRELARWVQLGDAALDAEIGRVTNGAGGNNPIEPSVRDRARSLFAAAIETPGGLKIQTIHAFAERVLHLFPFETGIPVDFEVLTEIESGELMALARRDIIQRASGDAGSMLGLAFAELLDATSETGFAELIDQAVAELRKLSGRGAALPSLESRLARYRAFLGVPDSETEDRIRADFLAALPTAERLTEIGEAIGAQKKLSDAQRRLAGEVIALAGAARGTTAWIDECCALLLTTKGEPKKAVFTLDTYTALPGLKEEEAMAKNAALSYRARLGAFRTLTRSLALSSIAEAVLARYIAAKRARNRLDFDDLIAALRQLLGSGQANWVQMKLDSGIEHVLVDEAQDTTPAMWDVIRALTDEFFAGEGAKRRKRTLFVVGDEKQSIYSFQGADPAAFEASRLHFAEKSCVEDHIRRPIELISSFRSSADILGAVDTVFADPTRRDGLVAASESVSHIAARQNFPGLVEIWAPERQQPMPDEGPRPLPAASVLADRVADTIAGWLKEGATHLEDGAPIRAGDILVLVRKRGPFFFSILRALRHRRIPVAGADRLALGQEIAIHDLLVVAEALLQRQDDLALASALKSPFFALTDADLEGIARGRAGSLHAALRESENESFATFSTVLDDWRRLAETADPFTFFATLLSSPAPACPEISGRQALLTRLGPDAAEPIDAFLALAQEFSRRNPGSLLAFVERQRRHEIEIKRDLEQGSDAVRVMTVHGAKGLEARIVFLGDTAHPPTRDRVAPVHLVSGTDGPALLLWPQSRNGEPPRLREARVEAREKQYREHRRLLYVGMTRASDRLYLVGWAGKHSREEIETGQSRPPPENPLEWTWHALADAAFATIPEIEIATRHGPRKIRRILSALEASPPVPAPAAGRLERDAELPDWLTSPVLLTARQSSRTIRPSRARAGPNEARKEIRARGVFLHRLYETLPGVAPENRLVMAEAAAARAFPGITPEDREKLVAPVVALIGSEQGGRIFGPRSRSEVAIAGEIRLAQGQQRAVSGRIDRLVVTDRLVEIIDFKTGRPRPVGGDTAILRQMALYRAVITQIYPGRDIVCAILWSETGFLEAIPEGALDRAFSAITEA